MENAMKILSLVVANAGFIFLLMVGTTAESAEIKVLAANGIQAVVEDLGPKFERATGHKLAITFATGGATVKSVHDGEVADLVIAPKPGIEGLVQSGKAAPDNVTALASTGISVAVRKGAPKPDISSPEALKRTLIAAKSITYLNPVDGGASGIPKASRNRDQRQHHRQDRKTPADIYQSMDAGTGCSSGPKISSTSVVFHSV